MDLNIVLLIVLAVVAIGLLIWLLGRRTGSEPARPAAPPPAEKATITKAEPDPTLAASTVAPVGLVQDVPPAKVAPAPVPVPVPAPIPVSAPAPVAKAAAPKPVVKETVAPVAKAPAEQKPAAVKKAATPAAKTPAKAPAKAPVKAPAAPKTAAKAPAKTVAEAPAPKAAPKKAAAPVAKAPVEKAPVAKAPVAKPTPAKAAPTKKPAAAAKPKPAASTAPDNLLQLKGVGPKLVTLLSGLGITRFDQIAGWSDADIARVDPELGTFKGRIVRDKWIEQAGYLAKGDVKSFEAKFGKLDSEN